MRNPYYRYRLAQTAVIEGDYKAAIEHLDFAIRKRPNEDRFYFLMGLSQMMNGDEAEAKHWMQQAEQIAAEADGQRYHTKIDRLLGDQADEGQEP
jgi:Flp pilus assembly protein TadD